MCMGTTGLCSLLARDLAARRLLLAHAGTKLGSKAWEFATPLLLLHLSPYADDISAPTIFGLAVFALKFILGPAAGRWMDGTPRLVVINVGIALQAAGVTGAVVVLAASFAASAFWWPILVGMIACGVVEALGALVSSVAVEKDWVPTLYAGEGAELSAINAAMANIDLAAEMIGPLVAGLALDLLGGSLGFLVVGIANTLTFGLELGLLRSLYHLRAPLRAPKPVVSTAAADGGGGGGGLRLAMGAMLDAWAVFFSHPFGIPLLVLSYSLLYFTVLSRH